MGVRQVEEFAGITDRLQTVPAEFRIGKLDGSFTEVEDAEAVVEEYFRQLDYDTFNLRGLGHQKRNWLATWFDFFDNFQFSAPGVPDLFVCRLFFQVTPAASRNGNITEDAKIQDYRFIEVKSANDDLRQSQLRWIGSNPHLPVEVIIVTDGDG